MPTFALNFSRPGAEVVAQYYTSSGSAARASPRVQQAVPRRGDCRSPDRSASCREFRLITRGDELPVFAFTTADTVTAWDVFAVSRRLRERGWQVPAYTFPANREDLAVLRVVCRNGFSLDLADLFLRDLKQVTDTLREDVRKVGSSGPESFHH